MAKKKTYADVLKELWAEYEGKKPYKEVQKMASNAILKQKEIARLASGKRIGRARTKKKKADKEYADGGKTFNRGFHRMGKYS